MKWFVILRQQNGRPAPMVDDDENLAIFNTESEAWTAGGENPLGKAYGFEVFSWE